MYFESVIPNWHFEPVSRKSSPQVHWSRIDETDVEQTGDKKIVWELNRHQYFTVLGRAYWLTNDEKYAETFVAHLDNWIDANPRKIGVNWMSSLEIAFRSISWLWAFHFFKDSPALTPDTFVRMHKGLYSNARHLETYLSTYTSPNTHLTGEALGLYFLGNYFAGLDGADIWKKLGSNVLLDALDFQVRTDGGYCEQSSQYQRYTTDFYAAWMILRQAAGLEIDKKHKEKLKGLLDFLMFMTQPNGETPLFGDDDGGRLHFLSERPFADFRSTLAVGAVLFDDQHLKHVANEPDAELLWLLGPEGLRKFDEIRTVESKATPTAFESTGVYVMRESWEQDSNFLLIDCGVHGFLNGGHAHADALNFVMSIGRRQVFVDPGTYNYTSDSSARDLYRSTAAHNCLTVNGESSSVSDGPFSWQSAANAKLIEWDCRDEFVRFKGTHDGFERFGVSYEREIRANKAGTVLINDNITSINLNSYELNFILSPELAADIVSDCHVVLRAEAGNRALLNIDTNLASPVGRPNGVWSIEQFAVSPRYGSLVNSTKLVWKVRADGNLNITNTISCIRN